MKKTNKNLCMKQNWQLWEIMVPAELKGKEVPVSTHEKWDKKVRDITGGLTILKAAKGQWISPSKKICIEKVIPVRIACSENDIKAIAKMTLRFYDQEQVMFYKVSNEVYFIG